MEGFKIGRITQFGAHIASSAFGGVARNVLYEPQREYNFSLEISFDQPHKSESLISIAALKRFMDTEVIDLALDSAFMPTIKFDTVTVRDINQLISFAGNVTLEGGKLVVSDYILAPVMSTIDNWVREVYDFVDDRPGLPDNYKKSAHINLLGTMMVPERSWEIKGLWPTSVHYGNLDMNSSERLKMSLELSYDSAVYVGSTELNFIKNVAGKAVDQLKTISSIGSSIGPFS